MAADPGGRPLRVYWPGRNPDRPVEWVETEAEAEFTVQLRPGSGPEDAGLTDREAEVLAFLADGWSNDEIADRLVLSARTIRFHLDHLYRKLGVGRRTEAVREAVRRGFLRL